MRWYLVFLLGVFNNLAVSSAAFAQEAPEGILRLDEVLQEARAKNPELKAAKARWDAARLRVPQAWALPDPTAGYAIMGPELETRVGPQKNLYEVEQLIPFPAKLLERRQMAVAEANAEEARWHAAERDVILKVSQAYYDLYATDASLRAVEEVREILGAFESIAQSRYASGTTAQRDVAKAQTEVSETLERLFLLRQQRQTLTALLNALLSQDSKTAIGSIQPPSLPSVPEQVESLIELAKQSRPELRQADAQVLRDRHANRLAKLDYLPDVSVGFAYNQIGSGMTSDPHDGRDAWMIPIKVTLPLWQNRLVPAVREAKRNLTASQADLTQAENLSGYEVRDAYYRFVAAKQVVALYENALLPQAELALHSDQAAYESGRSDALSLIDSERVYLNAKVAYYRAVADAMKSYAGLERAVGTTLVTSDQ